MQPRGGSLSSSTSALVQVLSLFSYERRVTVDARSRKIRIHKRRFWFLNSRREIPFERVKHIDYGFALEVVIPGELRGDETPIESFTISVVCENPRETVLLAKFRGSGRHEIRARSFLEALKRRLNVTVGGSIPHVADAQGVKYRCKVCKRNSPPQRTTCQYCGEPVEAIQRNWPSRSTED